MEEKIAVLFDLDGTLLDTLDDITDAMNFIITKHGFKPRSRAEIRSFVGNGAKKLVERAIYSKNGELDTVAEDESLVKRCYSEFKDYYKENVSIKTKAYDGIYDILDRLCEKGVPIAVVSNKPDESVKRLCELHFSKHVKIALGDVDGRARKPDPVSIYEAMKLLGVQRAIYVGDSEADILAARNADIPCISVTWGFRDKQLLIDNGAINLADDAIAFFSTLEKLLGINLGDHNATVGI